MYISSVSSNSPYMLLWAFVGPFLGLPFIGYIIDEKNWSGRFRIAFASAIGYVIGASVIFLIKK